MNGKRFKQIRENLGLSQEQLAHMLGFSSKQAVSNIETGFRNPSNLVTAVMLILKVSRFFVNQTFDATI